MKKSKKWIIIIMTVDRNIMRKIFWKRETISLVILEFHNDLSNRFV